MQYKRLVGSVHGKETHLRDETLCIGAPEADGDVFDAHVLRQAQSEVNPLEIARLRTGYNRA
jgi:hypothetical protein